MRRFSGNRAAFPATHITPCDPRTRAHGRLTRWPLLETADRTGCIEKRPAHALKNLHILLVEDDEPLAATIAEALRAVGWSVVTTARGEQLAPTLLNESFDAAILDINLPGIDGFEALRRVQQAHVTTPILVLTARDAIEDRLLGLDIGADDYLLKPFALSELVARLRVLARRRHRPPDRVLVHGPLRLNLEGHSAFLGGRALELSRREWLLLEVLMVNEGRVVSKDDLLGVLASDSAASDNVVEVYIFRLRSKVEAAGVRIRTVRGFGYMLDPWQGAPS